MNIIPVTYLCWGCGSSVTRYEPTALPIPAREVWNICPDCRNKLPNAYCATLITREANSEDAR